MQLIIDVGNTYIKLAVYKGKGLVVKEVSEKENFIEVFKSIKKDYVAINSCIVSSVGDFTKEQIAVLKEELPVLELSHQTKLPFINKYATPTTLGVDRIALISAAADQFPNENVLVIDAGSCITYDFINTANEYFGGAISPGIRMRYKAMNTFTAGLPLLETETVSNFIGDSTAGSMHVGVNQAVVLEIDGFITTYLEKFNHLTVILTGGDAHFLRDSIKNDIFANSNFLLEGLNHILEFNKHSC